MTYRPGTENTVADALSRKAQELRTLMSRQEAERTMAMFKWTDEKETHAVPILNALETTFDPPPLSGVLLTDAVLKANREDPTLEAYRQKARDHAPNWSFQQEYILYKNRLVVADGDHLRTRVIDEAHSRLLARHPGKNKTRRVIANAYWWPGLHQDVDAFVANCPCKSAKDPRDKPPGLLRPLPVPLRPWHHIIIDFKSMPQSKRGNNNTFNIIDKLSKETWSTACTTSVTSRDVAEMFYKGPFRVHGLPLTIGSDRGPQFVADFTNEMSKILGINWKLSSSGHSQSAGQIENYHDWMDQRLRMFVNHHQDNWDDMLPALDMAQATMPHEALEGMTPFEVSWFPHAPGISLGEPDYGYEGAVGKRKTEPPGRTNHSPNAERIRGHGPRGTEEDPGPHGSPGQQGPKGARLRRGRPGVYPEEGVVYGPPKR